MRVSWQRRISPFYWMVLGIILLIGVLVVSLGNGGANIPIKTVYNALFHYDGEIKHHLIVRDLRLPRILTSCLIGAVLSLAGGMMQGITKNPLADSGLMGLNAGAGFALAIGFAFIENIDYTGMLLLTFIGAGLGAASVFGLSRMVPGGNNPMKLILSGAAITAFLTALSQGIALVFQLSSSIMFWTMGNLAGSDWKQLGVIGPIFLTIMVISLALSKGISILSLGEEAARGLGVSVRLIRSLTMICVVIMAGATVSVAGFIGFIGMVVPHFSRFLVGPDYKKVLPLCVILGANVMVLSDLISRSINPPFEVPVGAVTAVIGVPFFLYIARHQKGEL